MRLYFVCIVFSANLIYYNAKAQSSINGNGPATHNSRSSLDTSILGKWPKLSGGIISNNGKYVAYVIRNLVKSTESISVLKAVDSDWKMELKGIANIKFSADNQNAFFLKGDSLCMVKMGDSVYTIIACVSSFNLVPYRLGELLVYHITSKDMKLFIKELSSGKEYQFNSVYSYNFSNVGQYLLLEVRDDKGTQLKYINLSNKKATNIWSNSEAKVRQVLFDYRGKQLAFIIDEKTKRSIWHYRLGEEHATQISTEVGGSKKIDLLAGTLQSFSKDGQRLFFTLESRDVIQKQKLNTANVNIWSYRDLKLQSEQLGDLKKGPAVESFICVLNLSNSRVIQLQHEYEQISKTDNNDDYCLILHLNVQQEPSSAEKGWSEAYKNSELYLVSMQDGSRRKLPWQDISLSSKISPGGKFIIYRDRYTLHYFSYKISTGVITNITKNIETDLTADLFLVNTPPVNHQALIPIAGWLKDDKGVFIYDRHDIWVVNPDGTEKPINFTNGFGLRNKIMLRLAMSEYKTRLLDFDEKILIVGFNQRTKDNGYYSKILGRKGDPELLTMGSFLYSETPLFSDISHKSLAKARKANAWLITRERANEFPNYYWTSDFITFKQMSNLRPEQSWNWMNAELHSWVAPTGDSLQGVLYKPQNFNPGKKYPVLFSYYQQFSNELHKYKVPEFSTDRINIPWFVSHGYLVFTPDILYRIPELRESVVNCVVSAAEYISKLSFVDSMRMGIQGHSFGGLETGYLVTNTSVFSAACAAAGSFNLVSDVGSVLPGHGMPRQAIFEGSFIYGTIWEKRDLYLRNSPIFDADKVTTPLLMMAGELDPQKPYDQNIEFFLAMRRLGKKAWLLSYEEEGHSLIRNIKDAKDYTLRMTQFFDHYLKGAPPPIWMTRGIPALLKGIETGYDLDVLGSCGEKCEICNKKKYGKEYTNPQ